MLLACIALSSVGGLAASEPATDRDATRFSIPAGTLDDALKAYAAQSKIQLLYAPGLVHGKQGKAFSGTYPRDRALALLLADHRLTAVAVNPNTYLLQNVQAPPRRRSTRTRREQPRAVEAAASSSALDLATVNVTGTRIPRVSLETTTLVTVISSDQIESIGHGTLYDLLRIQPGIFGHHPIAVSREGGASMQPMVSASASSLYSLGPRATLFLVDGKRVASYGLVPSDLGAVSDLTAIPLSFIDRIEILRGSASAVYGADAMAGTVNIILKRHMQGGEARLLYGTAEDGAAATRSASLSFGTDTRHGGSVFVGADILLREELPGDARSWHTHDLSHFGIGDHRALLGHSAYEGIIPPPHCALPGWRNDAATGFCLFDEPRARTLQPRIDRHALVAHWSQPFGNALQATVSARYSDITQALQAPPLIAAIQLASDHPDYSGGDYGYDLRIHAYSDRGFLQNLTSSNTFDLSAGIDGGIGAWTWRADAGYSSNRVEARIDNVWLLGDFLANLNRYRFNGLPNSADVLDLVSTGITTGGDHRLRSLEASAEGPAFNLPGGAARATVGIEWRSGHTRTRPDPAQLDSDIALGAFNTVALDQRSRSTAAFAELALPLHRRLHVDLATRVDRHEWHGNRWLPKVAMKWMPNERLMFRAGTSFGYRVPSAQDLRSPLLHNNGSAVNVEDAPPFSPCGGWSGYCNVTLGSMANPNLRPETSRNSTIGMVWAPTDSFSLGIDRFRILRRGEFDVSDPAAAPELFPQGLIRDATGRLIRIDVFLDNIGHSDIRGWDVQANYFLPTEKAGEFTFSFAGHHLEQHRRHSVLQTVAIDAAGHDIPRTTALASMRWHYRNRLTTTLSARHFGKTFAYEAGGECPWKQEDVGKCRNPSATLLGLGVEYTGIDRWTLTFDVANLANRAPVNYQYEREGYNVAFDDPYGRFFTVAAKYRF